LILNLPTNLMNNTRLQVLFQRYQQNACTSEEEKELFELLNQSDNPEANRLLQELWNSPSHNLSEERSEEMLNSILSDDNKVISIQPKKFVWLKAAAAAAIIVMIGFGAYQFTDQLTTPSVERTAQVNQQPKFIRLPDGSKVILNNNSKLEFPESFSDQDVREVHLTGEAYFDIQHDAKPFIVHTGKISTTVLGTAFNVKAYPDQNDVTVTVTRGKVKVSNQIKVLGILSPDDQITFNKNDEHVELQAVRSKEAVAWTEKDIFFDDVSMVEAADELSQRFDVAIHFKNENIKACRFTATFVRGEDLRQILDVICEFNQAKYKVTEAGDIEVSGDGCVAQE
jgi:transmembrane sensor